MGIVTRARYWVDLTFTLDTSAYAVGDLLAEVQELVINANLGNSGVELVGLTLRDEDDQAAAPMDVVFTRTSTALGTENLAYAPTDALGRDIMGVVTIEAMDWQDIGGSKVAYLSRANLGPLNLQCNSSGSVYVALVTYGTPTQTASGIKGSFCFE